MSVKQVYRYDEIRDRIFKAVDTITDPIRQTLSPRGGNVIYHDNFGTINVTNDGVTIAKHIAMKGNVENAVLDIIRHAALRTNTIAGDATSTTVLWSSVLIKEGYRLIENGMNVMDVKHEYERFADVLVEEMKKLSKKAKTDKELYYVANISSNNDSEVAENTVKAVKITGEDGMVFIEPSNTIKSEIVEDSGFHVKAGMLDKDLRNVDKQFAANYLDVPVLITDKRLYYQQEAEVILSTVLKAGYKEVVIVAKDFIGDALPFFVSNHTNPKSPIKVLLVKEPGAQKDNTNLEDLAIYLGGKVTADKDGDLVNNLKIENFIIARRVFSDAGKTLLSRFDEPNKPLVSRVSAIRQEIKKLGDVDTDELVKLKERLSCLTTGMVTIRVGGQTPIEVNEKIFRYEDAVNATRVAMKDGYIVGGGLGIFSAFRGSQKFPSNIEVERVFKKLSEVTLRQIATNCGLSADLVIDNILAMPRNQIGAIEIGFDANTMTYDNLLDVGVIDPFKAEEMALRNAVSIAGMIISSRYYVLNTDEDESTK